jgi:hypothetical protein
MPVFWEAGLVLSEPDVSVFAPSPLLLPDLPESPLVLLPPVA